MAEVNRVVGQNAYISFKGVAINADYRSWNIEETIDTVDSTAGSETDKSYIPTLKDGTAELMYAYTGTAGTVYVTNFVVGTEGALLYGPEGTATGKPKGGFSNAIVVSHSKPHEYNGLIVRTVKFQKSGTASFTEERDQWS